MGRKNRSQGNHCGKGRKAYHRRNKQFSDGLEIVFDTDSDKIVIQSKCKHSTKRFQQVPPPKDTPIIEDDQIEEYRSESDDELSIEIKTEFTFSSSDDDAIRDYLDNAEMEDATDLLNTLDFTKNNEQESLELYLDSAALADRLRIAQSGNSSAKQKTQSRNQRRRRPTSKEQTSVNWQSGGTLQEEYEKQGTLDEQIEESLELQIINTTMTVDQETPTRKHTQKNKRGKENKKEKGTFLSQYDAEDLSDLDDLLRRFITRETFQSLPFAPMSKTKRMQLHELCSLYNLKVQTMGSGKRKYLVATKTRNTSLISQDKLTTAIGGIAKWSTSPTAPHPNIEKLPPSQSPEQAKIVGQHASPLDESNLGNRMLRMMGWTGTGLGATEQGRVNPLEVTIKSNRKGLGF